MARAESTRIRPDIEDGNLVADLLRPDRHPDPVPAAVSLESTHMSWVFLTDTLAWKVKRPVDYGFADYSTLDARRHFCEEEVRLNRRLAPDVYLGVWPVYRDSEGYSLRGPGEIADYAVCMRRLPRDRSAADLADRGLLTPDHLDLLARTLAEFHAGVPPDPRHGGVDAMRLLLEENADQVEPFAGDVIGVDDLRALREWQEGFLRRRADHFQARVARGRIREGHGDLRLEHAYFIGDEAIAIDAVEFNERFRFIDVAADAAFPAMELDHRRRHELAGWFLGRYAAVSDDFDFYPLLDFHLCARAWIRAKVACLVAADPATPGEKRTRKLREARSLFTLAVAYTRPPFRNPRVVAIGGTVGSGKSTLADALSRRTGIPVVSSDMTRKRMLGLFPHAKAGPEAYAASTTQRTYGEILRRARSVLESGRSVVLDATFSRRAHRAPLRELADAAGASLLFVETRCDEGVARERLRKRSLGPSVSDAGEERLEASIREFEPVTEWGPTGRMIVDTGPGTDRVLPGLLERLSD